MTNMTGSDDEDPEGFEEDRPRGFGEKKMPEHYHGHRSRLWERFRKSDGEALEDYEVLELLLSVAIRRINTKPLAKALLVKFSSFADVLSAPRGRLKEVPGVGDRVADLLKLSQIAASRFLRGKVDERKILASWRQVVDYTRVAMGFSEIEEFRILFLDKQNSLIADEIQQRGTVDHTPVYPREVVKRALELSASGIVLIHNHPSGDTTPSQADINMTRRIKEMAELFGIVLHDHLIIGRQNHSSLRALKLF